MAKYHIGKNGPAPCTATKRACRYGGESTHYTDLKEANAVYEKQISAEEGGNFSKAKSTRKKPKVVAQKPEWTNEIQDSFNPPNRADNSNLSNYILDDYDVKTFQNSDGEWQVEVRPQAAQVKLDAEKGGYSTVIKSIDYDTSLVPNAPVAHIEQDEKGNYTAIVFDKDNKAEDLGKSKNPETLKKKIAYYLNPQGNITRHNSHEADKYSAYMRAFKPYIESQKETRSRYQELQADSNTLYLKDSNDDLKLYAKTNYEIEEGPGTSRQVTLPGEKKQNMSFINEKIVESETFTVQGKRGEIITAGNPAFQKTNWKRAYTPEEVLDLFQKDEGLTSGITEIRDKYGDETAEETVAFFANIRDASQGTAGSRNASTWGMENYEPNTRNKGEGIEGIKARLQPISEIKDKTYDKGEDLPVFHQKSEAMNDSRHISNSHAEIQEGYRNRAREILKKIEGKPKSSLNSSQIKASDYLNTTGYAPNPTGKYAGEGHKSTRITASGKSYEFRENRYKKNSTINGKQVQSTINLVQYSEAGKEDAETRFRVKRIDRQDGNKTREREISGILENDTTVSNAVKKLYEEEPTDD